MACIRAGASIVHNHNDEPTIGGLPAHDPAPYEQVWRAVLAEEPDAMPAPLSLPETRRTLGLDPALR